ncbi:MAG: hypothetical protein ACD_12C00648G0002 [uncultured bacterium]|nr:MAG: hypothetical protein ACD_12C00648G0002 [uncultured bacterium]
MKTVFLDSSVLFTAVNSPVGGSSKLFILKNIQLITSKIVLTEVERNIRKKLLDYHLERFFLLVDKIKIFGIEINKADLEKAEKIIVKKDVIILIQAKLSKADFLLTLDKKHFIQKKVTNYVKPMKIFTPKDFFRTKI